MIPVKDENPTLRTPYVTGLMILICVVVFVWVQPSATKSFDLPSEQETIEDIRFTYERAAIPCELSEGRPLTAAEIAATVQDGDTEACIDRLGGGGISPFADKNVWLSVLVSMFLHAGWLHLFGNMLPGSSATTLKTRWGVCSCPTSSPAWSRPPPTCSPGRLDGAARRGIGGGGRCHGGLLVVPVGPVRTVIFLSFIPVWLEFALVLLAFWLISQFFIGNDAGIAWVAHVAGFVFGVVAGVIARTDDDFERSLQHQYRRMARVR